MNIILRCVFSFILSGFCFFNISCKKNEIKKEAEIEQKEVQPTQKKLLIPIKLESDSLIINLKYTANTASLIELSNSDGYKSIISYKDQQPSKFQKYKNNKLISFSDYWSEDQKIVNVNSFDVKGIIYTPTGNYTLSYNSENQLENIKNFGTNHKLSQERSMLYTTNSNLNEMTVTDYPGQANLFKYTYDTRNGIFSQVNYVQLLSLEMEYGFPFHALNNCLGISETKAPTENITFTYQYNEDDYPSQITIRNNSNLQIFKITYTELKTINLPLTGSNSIL